MPLDDKCTNAPGFEFVGLGVSSFWKMKPLPSVKNPPLGLETVLGTVVLMAKLLAWMGGFQRRGALAQQSAGSVGALGAQSAAGRVPQMEPGDRSLVQVIFVGVPLG